MSFAVLIADDDQMLRGGLRCILESKEDIEVIGEAGDGRTAVEMARTLRPDVVVMDIAMPGMNGIEATRQIKATDPTVKVVGLSLHSNRLYVLGMFEAGASGYVLKAAVYDELHRAVQAVGQGKSYLSPDITGLVVDALHRAPHAIAAAGPRAGGSGGG
jgi:DNA-binding NarL/FixJ family response regulator